MRSDGGGNQALDKAAMRSRIDICSAMVIAFGLARIYQESDSDRPLLIPIS